MFHWLVDPGHGYGINYEGAFEGAFLGMTLPRPKVVGLEPRAWLRGISPSFLPQNLSASSTDSSW